MPTTHFFFVSLCVLSGGISSRHFSSANSHLVEKRHPLGLFVRLGTLPLMTLSSDLRSPVICGIDLINPRVYGWSGFSKTSLHRPLQQSDLDT